MGPLLSDWGCSANKFDPAKGVNGAHGVHHSDTGWAPGSATSTAAPKLAPTTIPTAKRLGQSSESAHRWPFGAT